jgi:hypothetical protein
MQQIVRCQIWACVLLELALLQVLQQLKRVLGEIWQEAVQVMLRCGLRFTLEVRLLPLTLKEHSIPLMQIQRETKWKLQ